MLMFPCRLPILSLCVVFGIALFPMQAQCQGSITPPSSAKRLPGAPRKSASSDSGVLLSQDAAANTLTLKDRMGQTVTYQLTEKTFAMKNKRAASPSDFKPGEAVMLRLRKSRKVDTLLVAEIADPISERWLHALRAKTTVATLKQANEAVLVASVGADEVTYTVNEKTHWSRGGKDATPADFKPGDRIYIVPATRANGLPAARAITDTLTGAEQAKERFARTLHGVLQSVDAAAHTLTLHTATGQTRTLPFTDATEVTQGTQKLSPNALQTGQHVRISLKRASTGDDMASRIVISKGTRTPIRHNRQN